MRSFPSSRRRVPKGGDSHPTDRGNAGFAGDPQGQKALDERRPMPDQERREPAPREDYPGPRDIADDDETQPGRTPEMEEQERARAERGDNEPG
jgi:hypothetical protein